VVYLLTACGLVTADAIFNPAFAQSNSQVERQTSPFQPFADWVAGPFKLLVEEAAAQMAATKAIEDRLASHVAQCVAGSLEHCHAALRYQLGPNRESTVRSKLAELSSPSVAVRPTARQSIAHPEPSFTFGTTMLTLSFLFLGCVIGASVILGHLRRPLDLPPPQVGPAPTRARPPGLDDLLPASGGAGLFDAFKSPAEIIRSDTEVVEQHTRWLQGRIKQTDAFSGLIIARGNAARVYAEQLATIPAIASANADVMATSSAFTLSIPEINAALRDIDGLSDDRRSEVIRAISLLLREKLGTS
jgi:hypothetical protein